MRIVGHHQDRLLAARVLSLAEQSQHLVGRSAVEIAGRLVRQDQLRVADDRARDSDSLLLPAGQLLRPVRGTISEADEFERVVCVLASLWAAIVILCREILVSGLREYLAELKVGVPVSRVAKWKTALQLVSIGFLIAGPAGEAVLPGTVSIGLVLLWTAAALTIFTGWDYLKVGIATVVDQGGG